MGAAVAGLLGALAAFASPLAVSAALLWTLTASPLAVSTGTPTTFTLTAANLLLGRIGCVVVDVPLNFSVGAVGVTGSTAGNSWVAARSGNRITVWTTSGGDRLELLDSVTFTVAATAMSGGSLAWAANAYDRQDCGGSASLLGVPPIVVVTGPAVTPSPAPTPPPTPTPTPPPTPVPSPTPTPLVPLPTIPLPIPLPSVGVPGISHATPRPQATPGGAPTPGGALTASPRPADPASTFTAAPSESDGGSPAVVPAALPIEGGAPPSAGGPAARNVEAPAGRGQASPRIAFDESELDLGTGSLGLLGGATIWVVPVATIGGPGLIVLLWVALQTGGASVWIPAARRLRGEERRPAR